MSKQEYSKIKYNPVKVLFEVQLPSLFQSLFPGIFKSFDACCCGSLDDLTVGGMAAKAYTRTYACSDGENCGGMDKTNRKFYSLYTSPSMFKAQT